MPIDGNHLIQYFYNIREFAGLIDNPINMGIIKDWQEHTYVELQKWERDAIFSMDGAFRRAYHGVLEYHAGRKQSKAGGDKDLARLRSNG